MQPKLLGHTARAREATGLAAAGDSRAEQGIADLTGLSPQTSGSALGGRRPGPRPPSRGSEEPTHGDDNDEYSGGDGPNQQHRLVLPPSIDLRSGLGIYIDGKGEEVGGEATKEEDGPGFDAVEASEGKASVGDEIETNKTEADADAGGWLPATVVEAISSLTGFPVVLRALTRFKENLAAGADGDEASGERPSVVQLVADGDLWRSKDGGLVRVKRPNPHREQDWEWCVVDWGKPEAKPAPSPAWQREDWDRWLQGWSEPATDAAAAAPLDSVAPEDERLKSRMGWVAAFVSFCKGNRIRTQSHDSAISMGTDTDDSKWPVGPKNERWEDIPDVWTTLPPLPLAQGATGDAGVSAASPKGTRLIQAPKPGHWFAGHDLFQDLDGDRNDG